MRFFPLFFCFVLLLSTACTQHSQQTSSDDPHATVEAPAPEPTSTDYYYDFDDILVPKEMELQADESFILETPDIKTGVMVFKGNVEMLSLTNFLANNMVKDGWTRLSSFKASRTILIFEKNNRYCIINLTDGKFKTLLEIWVTPKTSSTQIITPVN